jgi:PAS domain S-box-containing protein
MDEAAAPHGKVGPLALSARRAIEQVRDQAMFLIDLEGCIVSWNEGVARILGWQEDEWIGQRLEVAFTPDDVRAGVPQAEMSRAAAVGRADDNRWMRRKSGEHFFALGEMTRMLDEADVLVGYLKVLRDVTVQRQLTQEREGLLAAAQEARQRAENQAAALTAAIDALDDGICIADLQGTQRCNRTALDMLGARALKDLQMEPGTLVQRFRLRRERSGPPLDAAELPLASALRGEDAALDMWATQLVSGRDIFLRCSAAPMRVDQRVVGAVVVYRDLSARLALDQSGRDLNRVQTVLQERDAELRALTDGVRDYAIFTITTEGRISSWHQGAELMKGYTAEEAIGMPFADLFTPQDRAAGRPAMAMRIAAESGEYKGDGQRLRKDGSTFEAAVVLTPLRGPRGDLRGYLKLTQDISERKRLEREREEVLQDAQRARAEAERANHSKGEFLATISHELRTPLSAILGWAHVLERGVFDPETVQHGLAAISRNARTQVQLIEDLLDMNRIESGQLRLDLQRIELGGVIAAAIDSALPAATSKRISLRTVFRPASGQVMGDAARLQQVVGNLLNNAIKFTPPGGQISVALTQHGDIAQIAVSDTGQGIEPSFLSRVFDRFQQQDATITRRHGGLGIGLAIVNHLVQLHGGSVQAHSLGTGMGATFTVTLPAAPAVLPVGGAPRAAAAAPDRDVLAVQLAGVKVLLVDDEPDVRAVTARVLQQAGAEVLVAANATEALELLRQVRPAVILSDIGMPTVDGYDLMRRVRELPAESGGRTPAAAFTAYARAEDRQRALDAGYQMHLAKPVPPAALLQAVQQLAGQGPADHARPASAVGPR